MTFLRQKACCCSPRSLGCRSAKPSMARALGGPPMTRLPPCPQVSSGTCCSLSAVPVAGGIWRRTKVLGPHWRQLPPCCSASSSSAPLTVDPRMIKPPHVAVAGTRMRSDYQWDTRHLADSSTPVCRPLALSRGLPAK